MSAETVLLPTTLWDRYVMSLDDVANRLDRITKALEEASVPYALVGGQAVALWVSTKDPEAVRTTKDVDILLRREDLPQARAAAQAVGLEYFEVIGVGMFLETADRNPRKAVRLLWAGEKVKAEYPLPSPSLDETLVRQTGRAVVSLRDLVCMKLMANRDRDRTHLRDMIEVGLFGREMLEGLPDELATRLDTLLADPFG
jgi:hypothetical protein